MAISVSSCKKDLTFNDVTTAVNKRQPVANAGSDKIIMKPLNVIRLDGSLSHDPDGMIVAYQWKTIAGPTSPNMWNHEADQKPSVKNAANLEVGVYQFELMVTDNDGMSASDTIQVSVVPDSLINDPTRIKIFDNLQWGDLCDIRIKNISSAIPVVRGIQVFTRAYNSSLGSSGWITVRQVADSSYWYELKNDVLIIHPVNIDCNFDPNHYDVLVKWN